MTNNPPPSTPRPNVFIDTNVFVYQLVLINHRLAPKAKAFFQDIENGKYQGAVTTFLITEYVGAVMNIFAQQNKRSPDSDEIKGIQEVIMNFLDDAGIAIYDADDLVSVTGNTTFRMCDDITVNSKQCLCADGEWRGVGGGDSVNVSLAQSGRADFYATFDEGFRYLKSMVRPLMLRDVY